MDTRDRTSDPQQAMDELSRLAREALPGEVTAQAHAASLSRVRERVHARSPVRWVGVVAACAAISLAALLVTRPFSAGDLTYAVEGAVVSESGYVQPATAGAGATLRFSDGTEVELAAGSRGRVAAIDADGARIALENGRAGVRVRHLPRARWSVDAGPFVVTVTGTAFDVAWSGADETLDLRLTAGSVVVRGPLARDGVVVRAGHRLTARVRDAQINIEKTSAADVGPAVPVAAASVVPEPPLESPPGAATASIAGPATTPAGGGAPSWSKRVAAGEFRAVVSEAHARGVEECMKRCSLSDLAALSDAARYAGEAALAHKGLLAQRTRYARSSEAREAAFLLGRMAEDVSAAPAEAVDWYRRYLHEAPAGRFAAEALGRRMMALRGVAGADAARPVAAEYLRRFPGGPYAPHARELTAAQGGR